MKNSFGTSGNFLVFAPFSFLQAEMCAGLSSEIRKMGNCYFSPSSITWVMSKHLLFILDRPVHIETYEIQKRKHIFLSSDKKITWQDNVAARTRCCIVCTVDSSILNIFYRNQIKSGAQRVNFLTTQTH